MKPIMRASTRINSCGLFIPYHAHVADDMLLAATYLGRHAGTRNHTAYSYHSNTPSLITSSNVGGREVVTQPITRLLFSSVKMSGLPYEPGKRGRKVWKAQQEMGGGDGRDANDGGGATGESRVNNDFWSTAVDDAHDFRENLSRICEQVCESFNLVFCLGAHCY